MAYGLLLLVRSESHLLNVRHRRFELYGVWHGSQEVRREAASSPWSPMFFPNAEGDLPKLRD